MTIKDVDVLKKVFTPDQPLGQISAMDSLEEASRVVYRTYFDSENYLIRKIKKSNPVMIIGRRGAGKTDALLSAQLSITVAFYFDF